MKKIFLYTVVFILSFNIISYSYFSAAIAAEDFGISDAIEYFKSHPSDILGHLLRSCGAIVTTDFGYWEENQKNLSERIYDWYVNGKISSSVDGSGIVIDASVTQELLDDVKQYASDNGGYVLVPTLKATDFRPSLFPSINAYKTFFNICSTAEHPFVMSTGGDASSPYYSDLDGWPLIIVKYAKRTSNSTVFYSYRLFNNSSNKPLTLTLFTYLDYRTVVYNSLSEVIEKKDTATIASQFYLSDVNLSSNYSDLIVSPTGVSVPVFDSLDDYVDYSLGHGIYYTGSNYDGVGKDVTITVEDIQKIQDGYYDSMYERLQELIQQNNVDPLDYEKLAELTDQVLNSLDDIEQNTEEGNSILQKILDVLNDMNGFLHTNLAGSSDIDLSSLYSRLDSVVNELRSMSSALGNISSSPGGSVDVDVGGIEDRLDGMSSQLSTEADILEDLNNAVDGTNSTLAELNSNISDLSSSLNEMYKSLDALKAGSDNTDVVNKLNDVQEQIKLTNSRLDDVYDVIHKYLPLMSDILQELKDIHKTQVGFGIADTAVDILQGLLDELGNVLSGIIELPEVNIQLALDDFNRAYEDTGAVEMLKKKFPFSIPWDIAFLVGFLADEPQAPKFELPLVFEKYGINEKLVIDFGDFEAVSKVSRTLLTIVYLVALMKFTTNIITKE